MFELSSFAQLDSIVNILSERYSNDKSGTIKIPYEKDFNINGNTYWDSISTINYINSYIYYYDLIDSLASDEELIKLTNHQSPIVQFYSAFALGKRDTLLLPMVLEKMLDNPVSAGATSTDVVTDRLSASMIFSSLWERKRATGYPSNIYMDSLYSIYLLHENTPKMDIGVHLVYFRSEALKPTIAILAFERKNMSAIRYINKWYKGEYYIQLNKVYLEVLDSNIVEYWMPATKSIIEDLIDLKDKETLRDLGGWLKNNREKWVGIKGIDAILDKSWEIRDSIKWGQERYPYLSGEIDFILGDWNVISGWKIEKYSDLRNDTIILERPNNKNLKCLKVKVDKGGSSAITFWAESDNNDMSNMVSCPVIDTKNNRISFGSLAWNWYNIIIEDDKLIFIKE